MLPDRDSHVGIRAHRPPFQSALALLPFIKRNDTSRLRTNGIGLRACATLQHHLLPIAHLFLAHFNLPRESTTYEPIPLSPHGSPGDHFALKEPTVSRTAEIRESFLPEEPRRMEGATNVHRRSRPPTRRVLAVYR